MPQLDKILSLRCYLGCGIFNLSKSDGEDVCDQCSKMPARLSEGRISPFIFPIFMAFLVDFTDDDLHTKHVHEKYFPMLIERTGTPIELIVWHDLILRQLPILIRLRKVDHQRGALCA